MGSVRYIVISKVAAGTHKLGRHCNILENGPTRFDAAPKTVHGTANTGVESIFITAFSSLENSAIQARSYSLEG